MSVATFIKALRAAGVPAEQILDAVETMEQERLAKGRARTAKCRNAKRNGDVTHVTDVTNVTAKENTPHTPLKENNSSSTLRYDEGAASAPLDSRTLLFRDGLRTLADLSGRPETKLRSLLGKWLKACDDDALRVLSVIAKAKQDRPASPVEWIEKHFQPKPQGNGHARQSGSEQMLDELRRRRAEREGVAGAGDSFAGTTIDAGYFRRN